MSTGGDHHGPPRGPQDVMNRECLPRTHAKYLKNGSSDASASSSRQKNTIKIAEAIKSRPPEERDPVLSQRRPASPLCNQRRQSPVTRRPASRPAIKVCRTTSHSPRSSASGGPAVLRTNRLRRTAKSPSPSHNRHRPFWDRAGRSTFQKRQRMDETILEHLRDHQLRLEAVRAALSASMPEDTAQAYTHVCDEQEPEWPDLDTCTYHSRVPGLQANAHAHSAAETPSAPQTPAGLQLDEALLRTCEHLSEHQRTELGRFLRTYEMCLSFHKDDVGAVPDAYRDYFLTIPTKPGAKCQQKPYRLSQRENEEFHRQIDNLLHRGIIGKAKGPTDFISPVLFVAKPHNKQELRMCVDYRLLNKHSDRDYHGIPAVDDLQNQMAGSNYITALDLTSGFWALPVAEKDQHKTAFQGPDGEIYVWHKAPMGLANSPAAFQRFMAHVLQGIPNVSVYIDDITIYTKTWKEHLAILARVFRALREAGLKVKLSKCVWGAPECKVLGLIVNKLGKKPDPEKTQAIDQLPIPRNVTDLKSFLGATGYFHSHIPNYAAITDPLRRLLKKGVAFTWDSTCQDAFEELKRQLKSERCLRMPDWERPFILTTDWSKLALGAVLSQVLPLDPNKPENGEAEFAIAFASRALIPAESHYAPTEGECLALVWAVRKFRQYLHGRPFTLRTDHASLQWLQSARMENSKLERWALRLQEFDYTVEYIKGENNTVADHLSRHYPYPHFCANGMRAVAGHCSYALCCAAIDLHENGGHRAIANDWQLLARPALNAALSRSGPELRALWEQGALHDIDAVPCTICGNPEGYETMVICDTCDRAFHLQCCLPPRTDVPPGGWHCNECCVVADCLDEMRQVDTPVLFARKRDPFHPPTEGLVRGYVLARTRGEQLARCTALNDSHTMDPPPSPAEMGHMMAEQSLPFTLTMPERRKIRRIARNLQQHPTNPEWFLQKVQLRTKERLHLVVPPLEYRWALISAFHDRFGHAGVSQTFAGTHRHFHWPGLKADVAGVISACHACQVKLLATEEPATVSRARMSGPLQHVHIDLAGPFTFTPAAVDRAGARVAGTSAKNKQARRYVVLIVDYFTKAAEFCCIPDKSAASVARAFHDHWILRYGIPQLLTSDNGLEFAGAFRHLLERFGIETIHTSVRHPQSNGAVERLVQTLKTKIASLVGRTSLDWTPLLSKFRMEYMQNKHRTTKRSPNELLLATQPVLPPPMGSVIWNSQAAASACTHRPATAGDRTLACAYRPEQSPNGSPAPSPRNPVARTNHISEADQLTSFLRERDERHARILQGVTEEILTAQTANVRDQTRRLLAKRAKRRGGSKPLTVGDLAYVAEASNVGFKATVLGPYIVVGLGKDTVRLRTSGATAKESVVFDRHRNQVARATTQVDVLEKLLTDAGVDLSHLATSMPPPTPDQLLHTHLASGPLPAAPSGGL